MEVGVFVCVPMAGKMFAARNNSRVSRPLDPRRAQLDHLLWVAGERALADNRIIWIRINVQNWRQVEINSYQSELYSSGAAGSVSESRVVSFTNLRGRGKTSERLWQPVSAPALLINGNKRRRIACGFP